MELQFVDDEKWVSVVWFLLVGSVCSRQWPKPKLGVRVPAIYKNRKLRIHVERSFLESWGFGEGSGHGAASGGRGTYTPTTPLPKVSLSGKPFPAG